MALACNPSYSGGGVWEDGGSRAFVQKVSKTPVRNCQTETAPCVEKKNL
jgi:hypothetical protein